MPHRRSRTSLLLALVLLVARGAKADIISLGGRHSCAVLTDGKVMCWGLNSDGNYGQLGDGTTTTRNTPVEVSGITSASRVSLGYSHSCAVLTSGKVMCWGYNYYGQLGDGTTTDRKTPVEVSGITTASSVFLGYFHSCALLTNGKVMCWGRNNYGQLGDGTTSSRNTPVEVSGITNVSSVSLDRF
jgi:alpha-tubulin suppressor-like RCC1 family protein